MRSWIVVRLITLSRLYFTFLFGWALARVLLGDRWWWLFALNSLAIHLFLPLPLILALAFFTRRRETWIGLGVGLALCLYLFGGLFLPKIPPALASGQLLTVMSYNVYGDNVDADSVLATIRAGNADVVTLQELNPLIAQAIQRELTSNYPHQVLDAQWGVGGMGVISRHLLRPTGESMPLEWVGTPQVLALDFNGTTVTLLHLHPFATTPAPPEYMEWTIRERERQAQAIADFVAAHPGPLLAPIDFNASDQSVAYAIVTQALADSWREAGWGLGHTFPSSRYSPTTVNLLLPTWLVRIDYVFHSRHWQAVSTWVGRWDGISDHRPVVAKLFLKD
jgi:vancomycin resistance protein VanJ